MRANIMQTNFTSGEVSPLMYGRVDVNKYANGVKTLKNFIVRPQGGICRRPGTQYIGGTKLNTYTRIISFVISNTVSYILEFGNNYIRFYTNGGVVGGGSPVEVVTPYGVNDLDALYVAQSVDELFIAHANYPPQVLTRTDNLTWSLAPYVSTDGPYLDTDTSGNKVQFVQASDITTMVAYTSAVPATATSTANHFTTPGSLNTFLANSSLNTQLLFKITAYTSAKIVTGTYITTNQIYDVASGELNYTSGSLVASAGAFFTASCVGLYAFTQTVPNGLKIWYIITGYTNSTHVTATVLTVNYYSDVVYSGGGGDFSSVTAGQITAGIYVEYVVKGSFFLAKILSIVDATHATVQVISRIVINDGSFNVQIASGVATSSYTSVFSQNNVGMFVRDTDSQVWLQITQFNSSSKVTGNALTMVQFTYPQTTMVLQDDRVIIGTCTFTKTTLTASDVGLQVRLQFAGQFRSFIVTSVVSPTQAIGTLSDFLPSDLISESNFYSNGWADTFRLGAWSAESGYPSIVAFFDQRLIWANTTRQPSTMWFSQPADFLNMSPTEEDGAVIATDAIYVTIASGNIDPITWIRSGQVLLIGTLSGEYEIVPPGQGALSPTNVSISQQSSYGSLPSTTAHKFGVATIFLQRGGNKLREMLYQFQFNSFNSKDITIISEHILRIRGGAKVLGYQVNPVSIFWLVCNNGDLVSCTYDRDQDIVAFATHQIAGGTVESIAVIPNNTHDDVYLVVNRNVGGTVRYIEMLSTMFDSDAGDTLSTMNFMDSYATYVGSPATNISGLTYLNGKSVYAIADGLLRGPFTVSGGAITLPVAASNVIVGITFTSTLGTLSPDGASQTGTSQGKRKTIKEITARVKDALPFKHGPDASHLTLIDAANFGGDLMASASQNVLFTGDVRFSPDLAWDQQATYFLVQDLPYPLTIDSLMPILASNE